MGSDTRQQAIDATIAVILEAGVQAATWRRIAAQAGLSPGTLTYHFATVDELVLAAFERLNAQIDTAFRGRLQACTTREQAIDAVAELICGDIWATPPHLLLSFELYAMASRHPAYRSVLHQWMGNAHTALRLHFSANTARLLDVLIEGATIHNTLGEHALSRAQLRRAAAALVALDG